MKENNKNNIQVPIFKQKLKNTVLEYEKENLINKISFYRKLAVAAIVLFVFSLSFAFIWVDKNKSFTEKKQIKENINKYASEIDFNNDYDKKLEKIMINETIKSGKQVYPLKVKTIMVKKVKLSNGKTIEFESKIDMSNYANAY